MTYHKLLFLKDKPDRRLDEWATIIVADCGNHSLFKSERHEELSKFWIFFFAKVSQKALLF